MPFFFNRKGPLPKFTPLAPRNTVKFSFPQSTVFCGSSYLKEYLSEITLQDVQKLYPQNAQEIYEAILNLQFSFPYKEGDVVAANQALVTVTGNPAAIELISSTLLSVIGEQTAVASTAKLLTKLAPGAIFAYLGYRRGPTTEPIIDYAAGKGGFLAAANTLNALNKDNGNDVKSKRRYIKSTLPVVGTIAHALITSITAIHELALKHRNKDGLCKALGITTAQYDAVNEKSGDTHDINDYVAFCGYINSVKSIERKVEENTGKPSPKGVVLLVDTTDTLRGVRSAMQAAIDSKRAITGIRLDTTPEKFIVEAWKILKAQIDSTDQEVAKLFANAKIYCTDGIEKETLEKIVKLCQDNEIPLSKLVFGIGSSIANTPALKLEQESIVPMDLENVETFSLAKDRVADPVGYVPVNAPDEYNVLNVAADFYAQTQEDFLHAFNGMLADNGCAHLAEMTSHLNFRHRESPAENYLVVAGLDQALRILDNFTFDDKFIAMMKASGLSYTDAEYEKLFRGKKLNVKIDCVNEGEIVSPYSPILSITGEPGHVLLVESFLLSTIGCMSSVATAANEIVHSLDYSQAELSGMTQKQRDRVCAVFDSKPTFVYWGESERTLSTYRANAAFIGGFTETTMQHDLGIPVTDVGISYFDYTQLAETDKPKNRSVCVDLNDLLKDPDTILDTLSKTNKDIQIRGDFDKKTMLKLREQLLKYAIPLSKIKFIVREPLASAENLKGTVYKAGALKLEYNDGRGFYMYGVKAAGNSEKGGVKSSIPGVEQKLMVLKDISGSPIATMVIDLNLLPKETKNLSEAALKKYILDNLVNSGPKPVLYYNYGQDQNGQAKTKDDAIDMGPYTFDLRRMPAQIEFVTREPEQTSGRFVKPATKDAKQTLQEAQNRAQFSYAQKLHRLPVLMEHGMNQKLHTLLRQNDAAEPEQILARDGKPQKRLRLGDRA